MEQSDAAPPVLVSTLAGDADIAEILSLFVAELPQRAEAMRRALRAADLAHLVMLAHQLKGAAGSYGFPTITEAARTVEHAARNACPLEQLTAQVDELAAMCRSARASA